MARRRIKQGDPRRAVAYLRVSTDRQDLGPEAQREQLARWAQAHGVEIIATCEDHGISGGAPLDKRPGLLAAVDALREHGAGILAVAKRDRLARNDVVAVAMLERMVERNGAKVQSADGVGNGDKPEDALLRRLIDAFSEYERQVIRARTRAALAVKRARGERFSIAIPYGFKLGDDGRTLQPEPKEQAALETMRRLRAAGRTLREITEALNGNGAPPRGRKWYLQTVHSLLARQPAKQAA